jgi:hypothetical protein
MSEKQVSENEAAGNDLVSHAAARVALLAIRHTVQRQFPNSFAVLSAYIDQQERAWAERVKGAP